MKTLFAHILTTVSARQAFSAFGWYSPMMWSHRQYGEYVPQLEQLLSDHLGTDPGVVLTYNARTALYQGLELLGIGEGDEVILQPYTCVSVSNAIIAIGATPIYVDIDPTNAQINSDLIEKVITDRTKAILIQHTCGMVSSAKKIRDMCDEHGLFLIEDCAHSLGAMADDKPCGAWGDVSLFSFGRDKVISSVNGGALIINHSDLKSKHTTIASQLTMPTKMLIKKNIDYQILGRLARTLYDFKVGKILYRIAGRFGFFPKIVTAAEKRCDFHTLGYALPNVLAFFACYELKRLKNYNEKRKQIALYYREHLGESVLIGEEGSIYLRCIYVCEDQATRDQLMKTAKSQKIVLGDRYQQPIAPRDVNPADAQYQLGSCPQTERLAHRTVNLPCHPRLTPTDLERITHLLDNVK